MSKPKTHTRITITLPIVLVKEMRAFDKANKVKHSQVIAGLLEKKLRGIKI